MINILHNCYTFNVSKKEFIQYGTNQRIYDLYLYMNEKDILYKKELLNNYYNTYNIFSSLPTFERYYETSHPIIKHTKAIMICATNIIEAYKKRYDVLINKTKKLLIFHNAYKSYLFRQKGYDSIFLPMFLYKYNLPKIESKQYKYKYKYGISLDSSVCTITFITMIKKLFPSLLVMSRDEYIRNIFDDNTTDKQYFFNSVENIISLSDKYNSSHVGSRFLFECMYLQKPIYILCTTKDFILDRTLQQFSSLQYEYVDVLDMFTLWKVNNINPKLVMYQTYDKYMQIILRNIENKKNRTSVKQYQYAEDYIM